MTPTKTRLERALLNSTAEGIYGVDTEGHCTFLNASASRMLGYSPEECLGKDMHELIHHTHQDGSPYPDTHCPIINVLRSRTGTTVEDHLWRRDGTAFPVVYSAFPAIEDGAVFGLVVTFTDITERKKAEADLQFFRHLVDQTQDAVYVLDPKAGFRFIHANEACCALFGAPMDAVLRMAVPDWAPDFPLERCEEFWQTVKARRSLVFEARLRRVDGAVVPVEVAASYMEFRGKEYVVGTIRDITERKRIGEQIRLSEERYRSLFETSRDGLVFVALDGRITEANPAYLDMVGYTRGEVLNMTYQQLTPARWASMEAEIVEQQILGRGYSDEYEKEYIRKDGSIFPISVRGWLVRDSEGRPKRILGAIRDITERKRVEADVQFFRDLIDQTNDPTYVLSPEAGFRMVYANQASCQIFGYPEAALLRLTIPDFAPDFPLERCEEFWRSLRKEKSAIFETRMRSGSGEVLPVEVTASYLEIQGKEYLAGTVHDITERKRAETELLKAQKRLELALKAGEAGLWSWDVKTNEVYMSPSWKAQLGSEDHEIANRYEEFECRIHPDDLERMRRQNAAFIANPTDVYETEFRLRHKDGTYRWMHSRAAMYQNAEGQPAWFTGCNIDITERKRAEGLLQYQNVLLTTQQETSPDGILVVDDSGTILTHNRRFAEMWNISDEILESKSGDQAIQAVLGLLEQPEAFTALIHGLRTHAVEKTQGEIPLRDGRTFDCFSSWMVGRDGTRYGRVWYFRDITERKRMEDLIRASLERNFRQSAALVALTEGEGLSNDGATAVWGRITATGARALGAARVSIWLADEDRSTVRCEMLYDVSCNEYASGMELRVADYPAYFQALVQSEIIDAADARLDPRTRELAKDYLIPLNIGSVLTAGLRQNGSLVGILSCEGIGAPRTWAVDEKTFVLALRNFVSLTLEQARRIRDQSEVHRSRAMLRQVIDNIPQSIAWKDLQLTYRGCNTVCAQAAGVPAPDDIVGKSDGDLSWKALAERYRADDRRVLSTGVPKLHFEEEWIGSDGTRARIIKSKVPLFDESGEIIGVLVISEDMKR